MPASLQGLPVETRQTIYSYTLVEQTTIIIDPYKVPGREIRFGVVRRDHHRDQSRRGEILVPNNDGTSVWVKVFRNAALLRVDKQTLADAAPVLYGCNKFKLFNTRTLERFLDQIQDMKKNLHHVSIQGPGYGWKNRNSGGVLHALAGAEDLRSLSNVFQTYIYKLT